MTDFNEWTARARELEGSGLSPLHASGLAGLEMRIRSWPTGWGDDLQACIFGDFEPPDSTLTFPALGITIAPEKITGSVITSARTVLRARVAVVDKTVESVRDAMRRLNLLVGVLTWGGLGTPVHWWSYLTHPGGGGVCRKLGEQPMAEVLGRIESLDEEVRNRINAALYWMRAPCKLMLEHHHQDVFAVFAGYWNAVECLIDAANKVSPRCERTAEEKNKLIRQEIAEAGTSLTTALVRKLYADIVNVSLRARVEHGLRVCIPECADRFFRECYEVVPQKNRLPKIRNSIDHGSIDVHDPETAIRVTARLFVLQEMVFRLLGGLLRAAQQSPRT